MPTLVVLNPVTLIPAPPPRPPPMHYRQPFNAVPPVMVMAREFELPPLLETTRPPHPLPQAPELVSCVLPLGKIIHSGPVPLHVSLAALVPLFGVMSLAIPQTRLVPSRIRSEQLAALAARPPTMAPLIALE